MALKPTTYIIKIVHLEHELNTTMTYHKHLKMLSQKISKTLKGLRSPSAASLGAVPGPSQLLHPVPLPLIPLTEGSPRVARRHPTQRTGFLQNKNARGLACLALISARAVNSHWRGKKADGSPGSLSLQFAGEDLATRIPVSSNRVS